MRTRLHVWAPPSPDWCADTTEGAGVRFSTSFCLPSSLFSLIQHVTCVQHRLSTCWTRWSDVAPRRVFIAHGKAERKCGSFNLGRKKPKKTKTATNSSFNRVPPPVSVAVWGIVSAHRAGTSPSALGTIRAPLRSQLAEEPPPYQLMDESTGMPARPPPRRHLNWWVPLSSPNAGPSNGAGETTTFIPKIIKTHGGSESQVCHRLISQHSAAGGAGWGHPRIDRWSFLFAFACHVVISH